MTALKWFLAYSSQILGIFCALLLLSLLIWHLSEKRPKMKEFAKNCMIFCAVMVLLSIAGTIYSSIRQKSSDKNAILCDYTEAALDWHILDLPWMDIEKLQNHSIRFFVGKWNNATTLEELCHRYTTIPIVAGEEIVSPIYRLGGDESVHSKTKLVAFNTEFAKSGFEDEFIVPLSSSVEHTVAGVLLLDKNEWSNAIHVLNDALVQNNGVAAYYLYLAYFTHANGLGTEKNNDLQIQYLKKSADLGYRKAQLQYGQHLLEKGGDIDIAIGLQYLRRAAVLSEFRTPPAMGTMHNAIEALHDYYLETGQFDQAYSFTKEIIKENRLEYLNYQYHLDNCLRTGRYSEALDIIRKGSESKDHQEAGYCRVVKAKMFYEGLGVQKDLRKAELALRAASDSLDYPYARKMLAEFYSREGEEEEAAFWQKLYDIRFRSTISE